MEYYNPQKILSMKDLEGKEPAIYLITTNRSAGKTTSFLIKALRDFKKNKKQIAFLYRFSYELNSVNEIFKDVLAMYPDLGKETKAFSHAKGLFYEIFLDDEPLGFALSLTNTDALKKYSSLFADVDAIIFDEFQSENGKYITKEVEKFQSLYISVARGGGQQSRPVKVFMLGNMVTIMNPYFIQFGIHKRLRDNTNFMRGNGWVAEFGFNKSASKAIKDNGFFRAFEQEDYMTYSTEKVYLHDADIFIQKPKGRSKYICTLIHDSTQYGVREYYDEGIIYISHKPDNSSKNIITFKASDHNQNSIMLTHYSFLWKNISDAFKKGYLRFDDMKSKSAVFDILSVDLYK